VRQVDKWLRSVLWTSRVHLLTVSRFVLLCEELAQAPGLCAVQHGFDWAGRRLRRSQSAMKHRTTIIELGEGTTQAVCSCGWRSKRYGVEKNTGTMDALQRAQDAADLHEWDATMS